MYNSKTRPAKKYHYTNILFIAPYIAPLIASIPLLKSIFASIALPSSFTPGENFLAGKVSHAFERAAFLKLPCHALVHPILYSIDVLVASDLGLIQLVCISQRCFSTRLAELLTFSNITGLVLSEPGEIFVLNPRHPVLILLVVVVLCGLHVQGG